MNDKTLAFCDKVMAVVCFALSAASQAFLVQDLAALFFSVLFLLVGLYEFWAGVTGGGRHIPSIAPHEPAASERPKRARRSEPTATIQP